MDVPPKPSRPVLHPGLTLAERVKCATLLVSRRNATLAEQAADAMRLVDALESEALKREKVPYVPPRQCSGGSLPAPFSGIDP